MSSYTVDYILEKGIIATSPLWLAIHLLAVKYC